MDNEIVNLSTATFGLEAGSEKREAKLIPLMAARLQTFLLSYFPTFLLSYFRPCANGVILHQPRVRRNAPQPWDHRPTDELRPERVLLPH